MQSKTPPSPALVTVHAIYTYEEASCKCFKGTYLQSEKGNESLGTLVRLCEACGSREASDGQVLLGINTSIRARREFCSRRVWKISLHSHCCIEYRYRLRHSN